MHSHSRNNGGGFASGEKELWCWMVWVEAAWIEAQLCVHWAANTTKQKQNCRQEIKSTTKVLYTTDYIIWHLILLKVPQLGTIQEGRREGALRCGEMVFSPTKILNILLNEAKANENSMEHQYNTVSKSSHNVCSIEHKHTTGTGQNKNYQIEQFIVCNQFFMGFIYFSRLCYSSADRRRHCVVGSILYEHIVEQMERLDGMLRIVSSKRIMANPRKRKWTKTKNHQQRWAFLHIFQCSMGKLMLVQVSGENWSSFCLHFAFYNLASDTRVQGRPWQWGIILLIQFILIKFGKVIHGRLGDTQNSKFTNNVISKK